MAAKLENSEEARSFVLSKARKCANGCWKGTTGYVEFQGARILLRRLSFLAFNGPVDARAKVRHLCGAKVCCNPEHLATGPLCEIKKKATALAKAASAASHAAAFAAASEAVALPDNADAPVKMEDAPNTDELIYELSAKHELDPDLTRRVVDEFGRLNAASMYIAQSLASSLELPAEIAEVAAEVVADFQEETGVATAAAADDVKEAFKHIDAANLMTGMWEHAEVQWPGLKLR